MHLFVYYKKIIISLNVTDKIGNTEWACVHFLKWVPKKTTYVFNCVNKCLIRFYSCVLSWARIIYRSLTYLRYQTTFWFSIVKEVIWYVYFSLLNKHLHGSPIFWLINQIHFVYTDQRNKWNNFQQKSVPTLTFPPNQLQKWIW